MAITINNSANITYKYGTLTDGALSNVVSTQLAENYSLKAEKSSLNNNWRPSENLTFFIKIMNDGVEPLYAISVQDDLGENTDRLLTYIVGSAKIIKNDIITSITPTNTAPLTFALADTLEPGEVITLSYISKVKSDIDNSITNITNEATIVGHQESITGPTITVSPNPSTTITKANYAEVRIEKNVDKQNISVGDKLTYTFILENSGNIEATDIVITDNLPEKFVIESIVSETNGIQTIFEAADYSVDTNNKLILPTSTTKKISVPARIESGNGITTVTIVGQITA